MKRKENKRKETNRKCCVRPNLAQIDELQRESVHIQIRTFLLNDGREREKDVMAQRKWKLVYCSLSLTQLNNSETTRIWNVTTMKMALCKCFQMARSGSSLVIDYSFLTLKNCVCFSCGWNIVNCDKKKWNQLILNTKQSK